MPREIFMGAKSPIWSDFVFYGDHDLLAFSILYSGGMAVPSMFHASQTIEKYLKALALSIHCPDDGPKTLEDFLWLKSYDFGYLAQRCSAKFPYYLSQNTLDNLYRFARFDKVSRHPWFEQSYGSGFTSEDAPIFMDLVFHLRNDIPIVVDDFPLGLLVRGYSQLNPHSMIHRPLGDLQRIAVACLRKLYGNLDGLVRWK